MKDPSVQRPQSKSLLRFKQRSIIEQQRRRPTNKKSIHTGLLPRASAAHLLLCAPVGVHLEVHFFHEALDHADRVRTLRLRVDALVHYDCGNISRQAAEVRLALLVRHLELAVVQDLRV